MYASRNTLSTSPRENEIPIVLTTQSLPIVPYERVRLCDFSFPLNPGLQLSNTKWSIGLKALTIPSRIQNIDSSFIITILAQTNTYEVRMGEMCTLTRKSITDFLNQQLSTKSSYGANIKFGISGTFCTCAVTRPPGITNFGVQFSRNLCRLLGFELDTEILAASTGTLSKASRLCDPYADFKLITVKCANASPLSTAQMRSEEEIHPETSLDMVQVVGNFGIDDVATTLALSNTSPCSLFTVSIPMESVVFYPLSSQTLYSVKCKLVSLSDQLLRVDAGLPVVIEIILRKSDHPFM
jgi:hypothetical protein